MDTAAGEDEPGRVGYRRSAGTARGEARRQELLDRVTDDLAENGLVDYSLRRAARAAGTTHKVLLYYFDGADDLLRQAVLRVRERAIVNELGGGAPVAAGASLAVRMRAAWPIFVGQGPGRTVLDQATGLAMYDPERYGALGRDGADQYLPALVALCPPHWGEDRKQEIAELILAVARGLMIDLRASGDWARVDAGFEAMIRALEREEAADG